MLSFILFLQPAFSYFAPGKCPTPTLQPNFDISKYLGLWYDMVHVTDFYWELGGDCDTAQYSASSTPGKIVVYNSEYKNNAWSSYQGSASCQSSQPAKCSVQFFPLAPPGDYEVVETDYLTYSFVFSCQNTADGHNMWAWILARNQNFNATTLVPLFLSFGFPESEVDYTVQTGCPPPPKPPSVLQYIY